MAHDQAVRSQVRRRYIEGMSLPSAAEVTGVSYQTARNWKRHDTAAGHDWDMQRNARRMTKSGVEEMANEVLGGLAEQFISTLDAVKKDEKMSAESRAKILVQLMDGYNKAISAATRAMPNANRLAVAMDVIKHLTDLIAKPASRSCAQPFVGRGAAGR